MAIAAFVLLLVASISAAAKGAQPSPGQTVAQVAGRPTPVAQGSAAEGSPVLLDGKEVFRVRWGYKTFGAASRASNISGKLRHLADDSYAPRFSVEPEAVTADVMSGETLVASVFDGDAKAAGISKEEVARQWASSMQYAVDTYRTEHSLRLKAIRLGLALLTILGCIALIALSRVGTRKLARDVGERFEKQISKADKRVAALLDLQQTKVFIRRTFTFVHVLVSGIILWVSLRLLLSIFPSTRRLAAEMQGNVLRPIRAFYAAFLASLPSLIFILIVLVVAWYGIRLVHFFFRRVAEGEIAIEGFRPAWASTTDRLVTIGLVILAVLVAYPYIPGSESAAFKGISLFLGVLVSLGSTGLVANAVTGVSLTYLDAFAVGDLVKVGDVVGWVTKMGMLTTRVRTRKNEVITLPNSVVTSKEIINFSKPGTAGVIVSSKVGIGYDTPWRQVEGMLKLAVTRTRGIRRQPEPFVLELSLNTFDITYEINAYLEAGDLLYVVLAELNRNILDAFNEFGVQIMTPAYVADPSGAKVVPQEQWRPEPAAPTDDAKKDVDESKAAD